MRTKVTILFLAVAAFSTVALHQVAAQQGAPAKPPLRLMVNSVTDGGMLPEKYSCAAPEGKFVSPAGTTSYILLFHDTDARPAKKVQDVTHWLIFNILGDATDLPEGVAQDAPASVGVQRGNIRNLPAYFGPCPPPGQPHHYIFELLALDNRLDLQAGASREDVLKAADGHVLGAAGFAVLFHR